MRIKNNFKLSAIIIYVVQDNSLFLRWIFHSFTFSIKIQVQKIEKLVSNSLKRSYM